MIIINYIRLIIGSIFLFFGLLVIFSAIVGLYRLGYVLNRMHVAATCDTLALFIMLLGIVIIENFSFTILKIFGIIVFFWLTSPICSHLIAKVEAESNEEHIEEECEVIK